MKRLTKIGALAVGAVMATMGAQASQTPFELGFTETGSSDYIIDLGALNVTSTSVVDLSSDLGNLSTFNSTFGGTANGVNMAVVSGNPTFGQYDVYATQLRVGGAGSSVTVAGSDLTTQGHSTSQISGAAAVLTGNLAWPTTAGTGMVDGTLSYTTKVEASTASSFLGKSGVQAASTIGSSGILYEDLWTATPTQAYSYLGYFTFNYGADSLTFTSANVVAAPEPAAYGSLAGLGLLVVALRRQFVRKTA